MKTVHAIFILILILLLQNVAKSQSTTQLLKQTEQIEVIDNPLLSQTFAYEGTTYVNTLLSQDFAHSPVWKAASGEPPLSVGNALRIARQNLRRLIKKANQFKVSSVALKEFADERWFYEVRFGTSGGTFLQESPNNYRLVENEFQIFVKMDGTIVEPKILYVQPKPSIL